MTKKIKAGQVYLLVDEHNGVKFDILKGVITQLYELDGVKWAYIIWADGVCEKVQCDEFKGDKAITQYNSWYEALADDEFYVVQNHRHSSEAKVCPHFDIRKKEEEQVFITVEEFYDLINRQTKPLKD